MLPQSHPLIESATKLLAENAEQHLAAKALLEENFDPNHPDIPETLRRLNELDTKKPARFWKWLLPCIATTMIGLVCFSIFTKAKLIRDYMRYVTSMLGDGPIYDVNKGLSKEEALLLGDPKKSDLQQKELLLASAPDRPDFYADYLTAYLNQTDRLPSDYFETIARIDPDNAYFLYLAAGVIGAKSVEKIPRTSAEISANAPVRYKVLDEARMEEALELHHKARALPRFDSYSKSMIVARIKLLKQETLLQRLNSIAYLAGTSTSVVKLRYLADVVAAEAGQLADTQNREALNELIKDNEHYIKLYAASPVANLVEELVFQVITNVTSKALHESATKLGEDFEFLETRIPRIEAREQWRKGKRGYDEDDELVRNHASLLQSMLLPMVGRQVQKRMSISKEDLNPGRLVEHDVISQFLIAIVGLIIFLCLIPVILFRFRAPFHARKIADLITRMPTPRDWAWIIGAGVVLPIATMIFINRYTPLGGRDFSILYLEFLFPVTHFALLISALLATPVLIIRWRLAKIFRPIGVASRKSWIGWALLAIVFLAALITQPTAENVSNKIILNILKLLPTFLLLAIFISACRALFGKRHLRISRAVAGNILIPTYSIAIILLCLLYPLLVISERNLIAQDTLMKFSPDSPSITSFEYDVTVQLRKEIVEMIGH